MKSALGALADVAAALDKDCVLGVLDGEGQVLYVNDRFCELSGYERAELLARGRALFDERRHPDAFFAALWSTVQRGQVWRGEIEMLSRTGRPFRVAATLVPLFNAARTAVERCLAVCNESPRDAGDKDVLSEAVQELAHVTERARERVAALSEDNVRLRRKTRAIIARQAQRVHQEKLSSLGLMATAVAHEINNPLAGVMACVKALREGAVPAERRPAYFDTIEDALGRMRETVESLLHYARPAGGGMVRCDLGELAKSCLLLLTPIMGRLSVTVTLALEPEEVVVEGRRSDVMQALMNVLTNAVQASPREGVVLVCAAKAPARAGVCITDEGPGIPAEHLARVFEPFFTTKPEGEGTGLGLHVTREIMLAHGGDVEIATPAEEGGRGTAMTLWFPAPRQFQSSISV